MIVESVLPSTAFESGTMPANDAAAQHFNTSLLLAMEFSFNFITIIIIIVIKLKVQSIFYNQERPLTEVAPSSQLFLSEIQNIRRIANL